MVLSYKLKMFPFITITTAGSFRPGVLKYDTTIEELFVWGVFLYIIIHMVITHTTPDTSISGTYTMFTDPGMYTM